MKTKHTHTTKHPRSVFPIVLITLGLIMLGSWGIHRYLYTRALTLSDQLLASYQAENQQSAQPIHIAIGKKISLPVVEAGKIGGAWTVSPISANHVHDSALPGGHGNIIIYGHNLNSVFGYLVDAQVGDTVIIRMTNGDVYQYKITETHVVTVNQTDLLKPTNHEVLTLYTCTGFFDSLRFVARALPEARSL